MAARLDFGPKSGRQKVVVAPPKINLRRAASYTNQERAGPLSSTSSRFNFNHLLFSPPPSPSLPSLVSRPKRSSSPIFTTRPRRLLRLLLYLFAAVAVFYAAASAFRIRNVPPVVVSSSAASSLPTVGRDLLPDFPTPVVISDSWKRWKWTLSIPHEHEFPLSMQEYAGMSGRCREVSMQARARSRDAPLSNQMTLADGSPDDRFVDVEEAERTGLLPAPAEGRPPKRSGHFVGLDWEAMAGAPVCRSSLTYVLESPDAGLGAALMASWILYALAEEHGRAFFLDDSRWAYGAYEGIFQPPPAPRCRPPPRHHMLPCPTQARHLVVSSVAAHEAIAALVAKRRRKAVVGGAGGERHLLELARTGYLALFHLVPEDEGYVRKRVVELERKADLAGPRPRRAPIIGLHIRRGDRHPIEYQYRDTYIPAEIFINRARGLAERHLNDTAVDGAPVEPVLVVASDDPMVLKGDGFSDALQAQQRIRLATGDAAEAPKAAKPDPHVLHRFVDAAEGWEGGFFASMFWNLGADRRNNAAATPAPGDMSAPSSPASEQTLKLRSFIGRAYVMDLAVLARSSDHVVCAVSAMGCRLLAVMMGWERGMEQGRWVNVDGRYPWNGLGW
ncbi:hypothetical protein DCS_07588 [Drechmeria coniospora]|uniref:Uncharacterized protein n=1 Tax=Drechmeria coniospora TaxID=98403 RepID=A0A151GEW1_DRECN|nr:hypothetical protein DCS_07588 [Drechmeria coniospora]KYK55625.1 hypothetical protein DCS_07588 [Drechmeria coniospora]